MVKRARSRVKRYGVIFTCLVVRAVHIEVAYSLDTDSFINALRRFIARRGTPKEIRSDNGTNFTSAKSELKHLIREWNQKKIHECLLQQEVNWHLNPPSASHWGGAWERLIRTIRRVMAMVLKEQTLDDECLQTVMCEIEFVVNGRPLTRVSDDSRDANALTPNHLLMLKSNKSYPPGIFSKEDSYCRKRWRQAQFLVDLFWKRWVREYLPTLQQRQKWFTPKRNLIENDIVLIDDKPLPRGAWRLGRVLAVHKGKDGPVRSVKVKTCHSELVRPVDKLCLLEASDNKSCNDT